MFRNKSPPSLARALPDMEDWGEEEREAKGWHGDGQAP